MKRTRQSIDGFIPRQVSPELGKQHDERTKLDARRHRIHAGQSAVKDLGTDGRPTRTTLGAASIRESLTAIDGEGEVQEKKSTRRERRKDRRKDISKRRRIIKRAAIALGVILLCIVGYIGVKAFLASNNMLQGGLFGLVQRQPLQQDENGRSNFIIFGTAEDSEGGQHEGGMLTDSLMVLSVHQEKKNAYMVSIPRDLWVEYGGACLSGYQGKINEVFACGSNSGQDEEAGAAALQSKVGSILGLDIHYYIHLNFTAVVEAVDAVGGVEVAIESNPKGVGILDRNFDWKCGYQCHYVKYVDGEVAQLDGEHALALARARNAQGGYGLSAGNFDREKNQQKIIKALREKALSAGTLTNLGKVTGLIDALGNNLRTNVSTKEVQTVMGLASETQSDAITSLTLVDEDAPLVETASIGSASAVRPIAGLFDYSAIRAYIARNSSSNPVVREGAKIVVLNSTTTMGLAQAESDALTAAGYTVSLVGNAPSGTYQPIEVYQLGEGSPATASALKRQYGLEELKKNTPPVAVNGDVSFVVIVGRERAQ